MKLIVGLGNHEEKYNGTRHNVGFLVLDTFAQNYGLEFQKKDKFKGLISEFDTDSDKVFLLKPTTFYNLSGEAVRAVCDFYKILPEDVLVIHDELALPFGTLRTRLGGSDAGNNGVKNISEHLGQNYARIRVGIWNELRDKMDDADFVLSKVGKKESEQLDEITKKATSLVNDFINNRLDVTTHNLP